LFQAQIAGLREGCLAKGDLANNNNNNNNNNKRKKEPPGLSRDDGKRPDAAALGKRQTVGMGCHSTRHLCRLIDPKPASPEFHGPA